MRLRQWVGRGILLLIFLVGLTIGVPYLLATASNDRVWSADQRVLPLSVITGNVVEINNIRNFRYTSVSEYAPNYYNQTYNLDDLMTVDYIVEPFGNMGAAHTFLSFGFKTGEYVAISVEIRKEAGESFSPLKGILRNYELTYVIADERDVIDLRANHRKNSVYLYPTTATPVQARELFVAMLKRANAVGANPEFYNTLTNTCTTNIVDHINQISPNHIGYSWKLLLPEYSDQVAYELGLIDNTISLEVLRAQHLINPLAEKYENNPDFSKLIRQVK
jgi:hypothetical protein